MEIGEKPEFKLSAQEQIWVFSLRKPERPNPLPLSKLTPREREILKLLCEAMSHKEIAMAFGLSITKVNSHLQRIYKKLGVSGKAEAVKIVNRIHKK